MLHFIELYAMACQLAQTKNGADLFAAAVRSTRTPMIITDPRQDGNPIIFANNAFTTLTGYDRDEVLGRNWRFLQGEGTDQAELERLETAIAAGQEIELDLLNYRKDGTKFWNRLLFIPVLTEDCELIHLFTSQLDITSERERALQLEQERLELMANIAERQAELLENEARYRALFNTIDEGFCVIEFIDGPQGALSDYIHVEANPAYHANAGIPDVTGKRLRELVGAEADEWANIYSRVLCTGQPVRFERKLELTDRYLEVAAFRLEHPGNRQVAVLFKDISARRKAEDKLRELNDTLEEQVVRRTKELRHYSDIIKATEDPICAFDTNYRITAFNDAHNNEFRRVNGFDTKVGDVFFELFEPKQQETMRSLMQRALDGESFTIAAEFGRLEFSCPVWELRYTPLRNEQGKVIGAFHQAKDISGRLLAEAELEATQEALRQSQKMDAMGQLTGGVAHDFNNLLTPILGSLDLLMRKGVGTERERRLIDGAFQSAERAKTLVQRLLAFARRQPLQAKPVDLAALVDSLLGLIRSTLGPKIDVKVEVPASLPPAKADYNQLEMALLNLAVNARDAMPKGGELLIKASCESVDDRHSLGLRFGQYIRIEVADTGLGMDEATRVRAAEPFFSTKGVGKGTGLGLSMVHGLAAQLGGGLAITSAPGRGTTIELWLPISLVAAEPSESGASERQITVDHLGTALLVDDDELVRISTADMLEDLGYVVVEASSAEQALALMSSGLKPDVLVTDHIMPGINGAQLAEQARAYCPALPILIVSGYADVGGIDPSFPRLTKPFRHADLIAIMSTMIPALHHHAVE